MQWRLFGGLVAALAACSGAPVTPEQRRLAERRLVEPFLVAREVGCGELQIELTGNFHGHVGQPAVDAQAHEVRRVTGGGYTETIWTNRLGAPAAAFIVTIGEPVQYTERGLVQGPRTRFTVVNQVRLRVYEDSRPLELSVRAGGSLVVVREASGASRDRRELTIADGVLQER